MKIEKEYENIFRYCLYHVGGKEDAEDITQETFLRYLQHTEYHDKGKERPYLYKIAKNLCVDFLRKTQTESLDDKEISSGESGVLNYVSLRLAMEELSEEDREIIILRLVNGETISSIAEVFNTSRFIMSRRIRDITRRLKDKIGKEI